MVKRHAALWCMTLALVLVVVDAVDIHNSFVVVIRVDIVNLN